MAQAGKLYPRAVQQDMRTSYLPLSQNSFAPRKLFVHFSDVLYGTLNDKWVGIDALSDVAERTDDGLLWKLPHPTITTDDPYYRIWMNFVTLSPSDPYGQGMQFFADYWEAGIRWGRAGAYNNANTWWDWKTDPPYALAWWLIWTDLVDPDQFDGNSGFPYTYRRPATWEENQPYQPYRTRP